MTAEPANCVSAPVTPAYDIPSNAGPGVRNRFEQFGPAYRWILLFALLSGALATLLAATTINVALPSIIGAFGLSQDQAQWMSSAFLAASTVAMLSNAWAMAVFGPRATYLTSMILFISGSLLGAVSSSFGLLIVARAMQGMAAGLIQPMSMFLIFQTFPDRLRGTAIGVYSIGVVLAPAFGPALGGYAVDLASWRLVFVATVPIALIAVPLAALLLPGRDAEASAKRPPLDWPGLSLIALTLLALLSFFANGDRDGWHSDITLLRLIIVLGGGAAFLFWEQRHPFPALNLRVFGQWQFASTGIIIAYVGLAIYASTYLIPIFVQIVQHYSPTAAGVMMIPAGFAMVIGFPLAGRLSDRYDARWLIAFGMVSFAASFFLMAQLSITTPYWVLVGWIILSRIGISATMPPANTTAIRGVPMDLLASATGAASFLMQVSGAIGVTMIAVLLQRRMVFHGDHLSSGMTERNAELLYQHQLNAMAAQVDGAVPREAFIDAFQPLAAMVHREAMVLAFRDCFYAFALVSVTVFIFVAFLPKPRNLSAPSAA